MVRLGRLVHIHECELVLEFGLHSDDKIYIDLCRFNQPSGACYINANIMSIV